MNAPNQLSFLPDDYLVRRAQHRTNLLCASLFVVMIGAIAIAFTISERTMRDAEQRHAVVDAQYTEAAKRIKQLQQMQDKQRVLARQAELSSSLIDRVPRSYMLAQITNLLPQGVTLTDLDLNTRKRVATQADMKTAFEKKKAAKPGAKGKADNLPPLPDAQDIGLKLSGRASTNAEVAQFMTKLKESELFSSVDLVISSQFDRGANVDAAGAELRKFTIEILVNPKADVRPAAGVRNTTAAVSTKEQQ